MMYFFGGLLLWYILIFIYKTKTGSPSIWSTDAHIARLTRYVKPGMKIADLGCGDGRVLISAVSKGAVRADGWEIEPAVWIAATFKVHKLKLHDAIKIHFADMWRADLSPYDLVYVYQLTRYAPRFVAKCRREMKPGSYVIANTYPLEGLPLEKRDNELYIYKIAKNSYS